MGRFCPGAFSKRDLYMAYMHPEDIDDLAPPGERTVFRFLKETARPDSDFIGWYEPAIGEQTLRTQRWSIFQLAGDTADRKVLGLRWGHFVEMDVIFNS